MDVEDLKMRLAPVVFRLEWQGLQGKRYGTGFFISPDGLALTAYHNLPEATLNDPSKPVAAEWRGKSVPLYWKLSGKADAEWQQALDTAVLEARPETPTVFPVCRLGYLDGSWSRQERAHRWKGRPVALMGYPRDNAGEARLIVGSISADEPIVDPKILDDDGKPAVYAEQSLALGVDFQQNCQGVLRGVSGAPLLDRETREIVGVEFAAWPEREQVFATELHHVATKWPPFRELAHGRSKGSRLSLLSILFLAMAVAVIVWFGVPLTAPTPAAQLLDARPGRGAVVPEYLPMEPAPPASSKEAILGVTVWRLRPSAPADGASVRLLMHEPEMDKPSEWTPERVQSGYQFADGDHVRLGIESSRQGYLYVIDRERRGDGTLGNPTLIFPTLRIRGGGNRVFAGRLTEIPGESDTPPYLTLRPGDASQTGELLSIVVAPQPLPGLKTERDYQVIPPEQFESWRRWRVPAARLELKGGAGQPWTQAERAAGHEGERSLRRDEPAPQTLYRVPVAERRSFLIEIPLAVRRP